MTRQMDYKVKLAKTENVIHDMIATLFFVLHDKEGLGEKRLIRIYEHWLTLWQDINNGLLSKQDVKDVLFKECNLRIK